MLHLWYHRGSILSYMEMEGIIFFGNVSGNGLVMFGVFANNL